MTATTEAVENTARYSAPPRAIIQPSKGWVSLRLREFWEFRELLYFLVWREVKIRYKQTAIGAAWAIIQPLFTMVIFSIFFGRLAKVPSDGIPYPVFSLSGTVIWTFFANGLTQSSGSLVENSNLISKIYFPRLIVPVASVLSGLVDFAIGFSLLLIFIAANGIHPTMRILWLPAFLLLAIATALGAGLWLSALNVEYRDVRYVVPFLVQLWMFATPVAYPSSLLHEPFRTIYALNPLAGVVEGFRWALLGSSQTPTSMLVVSSAMAVFAVVSGAFYFRRMEKTFADLI